MGRFLRNVLIGIGIGLLIAPMPGEELRRLLSERFQGVLRSLSEDEQLKRYTQQFTGKPSNSAEMAGGLLQKLGRNGRVLFLMIGGTEEMFEEADGKLRIFDQANLN